MKLMADENVSHRIVERLEQDGHTVLLIQDLASGRPDAEVLRLAHQQGAILVTEDTDFGQLVVQAHLPSAGVILLRLSGLDRAAQPDYVAQIVAAHADRLANAVTVITPQSVRSRPLP